RISFHAELLLNVFNIYLFRSLRSMWMLCSLIDKQIVGINCITQTILWQHTTNGTFQNRLWLTNQQLLRRSKTLTSRVTRMTHVLFITHLIAGKTNLLGIDDYHLVAGIGVWCKCGLILPTKDLRYL